MAAGVGHLRERWLGAVGAVPAFSRFPASPDTTAATIPIAAPI